MHAGSRQVKVSEICLFVCFKVDEFGCHRQEGTKTPGQLVNVGLDFEFLLIRKKRCQNLTDFISYTWLDGLKPPTRTVLRRSEVTHV